MSPDNMESLRQEVDRLNMEILDLLNRRAAVVSEIGRVKISKGLETFDPARESAMLNRIVEQNQGPFSNEVIKALFKEIFKASLDLMKIEEKKTLLVSRKHQKEDTVIRIGDLVIGGDFPVIMAGPCSVESFEQTERIAAFLSKKGVRILRGGAFKPRTSPYSFQGLKEKGLEILREAASAHDMLVITEVLDPRDLEKVLRYTDICQIGARNMYNYELLKEVGRCRKPVMLKRGFMATIEEFLFSAEYVISQGNREIILCERGIRTFEKWTRNTLDISAIPIIKNESHLPVIVDSSHATGRCDILSQVSLASLAAGADGIMVEVHENPSVALSDGDQQMDFAQFERFMDDLETCLVRRKNHGMQG